MPGVTDEMREKWKGRVSFCKKHHHALGDWALSFIDSIDVQLNAGRDLSLKQSFKLGEIYHDLEDKV